MKPRAHWLTRFTSWFFNTSPEWVAREQGEPASAEPSRTQQQQSEATPENRAAVTRDEQTNKPPR